VGIFAHWGGSYATPVYRARFSKCTSAEATAWSIL